MDYPALVVELKWNKDVKTAINQIKDRQYPQSVLQYTEIFVSVLIMIKRLKCMSV